MSNIVKLNVGGSYYETTTTTLMRFDDSMLARMIKQPNEMEKISRGEELFIDRDGSSFSYILSYLRGGDNMIVPQDRVSRDRLISDADFYQLPGLVGLIKAACTLKVGDVVMLANSDAARGYFDSVNSKYTPSEQVRTDYLCWACHNTSTFNHSFSFMFTTCRSHDIPLIYESFIGKILSIDGQCAKVQVTKSSVMAVLSEVLRGADDGVFEIHIPLAYLKSSVQEVHDCSECEVRVVAAFLCGFVVTVMFTVGFSVMAATKR